MIKEQVIEEKCQQFIASMRALRESKGMTQDQLADATGLKKPNISRIEKAVYKPNLETIMRIAEALHVNVILK